MKSQTGKSKSKSRRQSHAKKIKLETDEDFHHNILEVNISRPKNPYNIYITEMNQKHQQGKSIIHTTKEFSAKYAKLSNKDVEKYQHLADVDKDRYEYHLEAVKKHLCDIDQLKEQVSPYLMFKKAFVHQEISKDRDLKEAQNAAKETWTQLSDKEKSRWTEEFQKNKDLLKDLKDLNPGKVNAYTMFIKDVVANDGLNFKEASAEWKKTNDNTKMKYEKYADKENLEKRKKVTLYEIVNGIKPKKPVGAFRYFYSHIKETGKLKGERYPLGAASNMYAKLSDGDRAQYERLHKEDDLLYRLHLSEYKRFMQSRKGHAPSAYNLYFADNKGQHENDDLKAGEILRILSSQYKNESDMVKRKYEDRAAHLKSEMDAYNKRTLDTKRPTKNLAPYNFYIRENFAGYKAKHKDMIANEIFSALAAKWGKTSEKERAHFKKLAEQDKERYDAEIKEYQQETSTRGRTDRTEAFYQDGRIKSKAPVGYHRYLESQIPAEEKSQRTRSKSKPKSKSTRKTKSQVKSKRVKKADDSDNKSVKSKKSKTSVQSKSKAKDAKKPASKSKGRSGQVKSRKEESIEKKAPKSTRSKSKPKGKK
jgi:hypothetical protein